jgi:cephalosporin-C deacetylase-like acetyl esterase
MISPVETMKYPSLSLSPGLFRALVALFAPAFTSFAGLSVMIAPDTPSGVYSPGETASWTVEIKTDPASPAPELSYKITRDGAAPVSSGKLDFSGAPLTLSASREDAGTLVAQVFVAGTTKAVAVGGAIFAPEKITSAAPEPPDFDAFWDSKLQELAAVPINPVLEKTPDIRNTPGVEYYTVMLDNIRGTKVRGQLARPSAEGKYPALLVFQYAGVYPLKQETVINEAKAGWLVLNISAHDQPIAEPEEFYDALNAGELKNYIKIGNEDRETSYFLRMFLGAVRAAEYLGSRPDWNGEILIATGTSQGGLQAFAAAAFCPKVTGVMTVVPAGCDVYGTLANRASSWPYWLSSTGQGERDMTKIRATAGYFDGINFAARIHCPTLVAYGLADETSRPAGVAAALNALKGPKEALILRLATHRSEDGAHAPYHARAAVWKRAALAGEALPPVKQ